MNGLKHDIRDFPGGTFWVVSGERGEHGAVTWGVRTRTAKRFTPITLHSPTPRPSYTKEAEACPFLRTGCHHLVAMAGEPLGDRWENAGRDEDAVWPELEWWYADRLVGAVAS